MTLKKQKKIYVLDTNVPLLNCKCSYSFQEHDVVYPIEVLSEIDKFKNGNESINFNAREFSRSLDVFSADEIFDGGAPLGRGLGKIKIILGFDYHPDVAKIAPDSNLMDNRILNAFYCFSILPENVDREIIFVSNDVNLRMKAKALKINGFCLKAEDYKTDAVVSVDSLYDGAQTVNMKESKMNDLFEKGKVDSLKKNMHINEFMILNCKENPKKTALAFCDGSELFFIKKDRLKTFNVLPLNSEQAFALHALLNPNIILVTVLGLAGTGKTILSLAAGLHQIKKELYDEMYFTRQTVSLGDREVGFLPGDMKEKISPFMQGMADNLAIISTTNENARQEIDEMKRKGKIVIEPLSVIRGRSIVGRFFIIDECQNLTLDDAKTILTRAGKGTKIVMLGDISQIDHPYLNSRSNGFSHVVEKFRGQSCYAHVVLKKGERSELADLAGRIL